MPARAMPNNPLHGHGPVPSRLRELASSAGFTLIEIAVVLAVIGMVLAIVLPRLPSTEQEDLKVSARTLASTLRYAQQRAAANRATYYLHFEAGTNRYMLTEAAADGSEKQPSDPMLQNSPLREHVLVTDVVTPGLGKVSDGSTRLAIGVDGLRNLAIIHLRSSTGGAWTVVAFPAGGKVKLYEGYQEEPS